MNKKIKEMPIGITVFLLSLIVIEALYFFIINFLSGIYEFHGYPLNAITGIGQIFVTIALYILIIMALYFILKGFTDKEQWARKFTMIFILWTATWPIWGMIIGNMVLEHLILFAIYVLMEIYLMTSYVKEYFEKEDIFTYGEWTLYVRKVTLKNDQGERPIYFFSKKQPKSGTPTSMPEGYEVGISERSNMPYLQKIGKEKQFKYKDWKLYKRQVKLKGGKEVTIYFFSKKKPKSGKPTPKPEGYIVGTSKRSNMPYLKKKSGKKEVKKENPKKEKPENEIKRKSNVIYVVSKPQPGQVKGDWAVRSHHKIFSHHRIKDNAIKAAREIAKKKGATVMIQKTDGTFSDGFKPRSK